MADQANVYVLNHLAGNITAARYCLPGDNKDLEKTISNDNQEMFYLTIDETYLIISPPAGTDMTTYPFIVSREGLLSREIIDNTWKVEIIANNLLPEAPLDVNVEVGDPGSG